MKKVVKNIIVVVLLIFVVTPTLSARTTKSTAIGFRGGFWDMNNRATGVTVYNSLGEHRVNSGGGAGWLYILSRVSDLDVLEISIGGSGNSEVSEYTWHDKVQADGITPLLLGVRHSFLSPFSKSNIQPYVSGGVGPYWVHHVEVIEYPLGFEEEVSVNTKADIGGYFGAGFDLMLNSFIGLNFDGRYHFVDFDTNNDYSGFDFEFGFFFTWGKW